MGIALRRLTQEEDGIPGWLAEPRIAAPRPGVLVLHHGPGLTADYKALVAQLAEQGFTAFVPNLYNMLGVPGESHVGQGAEIQRRHGDADFLAVVHRAWQFLCGWPHVDAGRTAALGHCLGGRIGVPYAAHNPSLCALVLYYATIVDDAVTELRPHHTFQTARRVQCPTLVLYGGDDFVTSNEMQFRLWQSFVEGGTPLEWHYFATATHGFANPDSEEYQPDRERLATHLVGEFLTRVLCEA